MATNGIISIIKGGKVLFKCVAGCDGMEAAKTAAELKTIANPTLEKVYEICVKNQFGCDNCLIVQSKDDFLPKFEDELQPLYIEKFEDAKFNPRWMNGTAAYTEIIELI